MIQKNSKKGSIILPTLMVILVIVAAGSTYLTMAFQEFKTAYRNADLQSAMNLAESGVEEVMLAMQKEDWSGWKTVAADYYYKTSSSMTLSNGRTGTIRVFVSLVDEEAPIVFSEGELFSKQGTVKKQIRLDLARKGLFANGLTAKDAITFNGKKITIDSYNSNYGDFDSVTNRNDKGSVGSASVKVDSVSSGNADIWGYIMTGGSKPNIGPSGSVLGQDSPSGSDVDWDRVMTDFVAEFPDVSAPKPTSPLTSIPSSGTIGLAGSTKPTYYKVSSFSNKNTETLVIDGPVVIIVDGDVTTKGEIQVTTTGSAEFYVNGNVDIGGNGAINTTNVPSNLAIFGTNTVPNGQTIKLHGNGALKAAVYAPNADLELKGGGSSGTFMGAAVAQDIVMTGDYDFHYDEALDNYSLDNSFKISRWRELIDSDEKVPLIKPDAMVPYAVSYTTKL